jgi:hypothetical protein
VDEDWWRLALYLLVMVLWELALIALVLWLTD